jgi:hypothetical protein
MLNHQQVADTLRQLMIFLSDGLPEQQCLHLLKKAEELLEELERLSIGSPGATGGLSIHAPPREPEATPDSYFAEQQPLDGDYQI